ncbi:MAG: pseudouridine synthase [Cellvibrionaceae bacterium]
MIASRTRLDRYLSQQLGINRRDVRLLLAQQRVLIDGIVATAIHQVVNPFSSVLVDGDCLHQAQRHYVMLNKPKGVVSATKDDKHPTVMDLLPQELQGQLHIVGRLDFNSTGLMLLTNDGHWSRALTQPETKVPKTYRVEVAKPITDECVQGFREGMHFSFEDVFTRPAVLNPMAPKIAEVVLEEGRYHQIKRMFARFDNKVIELHRESIGSLVLDASLTPGESRVLKSDELLSLNQLTGLTRIS